MITNNTLEDKLGGLERYVRELARNLCKRGVETTIVAKRWAPESPEREICPDGVVIDRYRVPAKQNPLYAMAYPVYAYCGVGRRAREHGPTVVHVHMGLLGLPLAVHRKPFLFTFHAPVWRELLNERQGSYVLPTVVQDVAVWLIRQAERRVATQAMGTVVLSEFMRGELAMLNSRAAARASLVPGGIDGSRFCPDVSLLQRPEVFGQEQRGSPVLFTARRLTPRTGVDELVRAIPLIARFWPTMKLKIAGTGPMQPELQGLAAKLGVGHLVTFLGTVTDDELVDCYRRASLVIVPSRELEGFGLMTAEALACGAAVVGTPAGATPELLRDVDPALVTDDTSAEAIAATIVRLLRDPSRLRMIREKAWRRVIPDMTWDPVADRYLEMYDRLLAST